MRWCSIIGTIFFVLFLNVSEVPAESADELFKRGNTLYSAGEYAAAAQLYDSLLQRDVKSAEVYFNLGNSYYKTNQIPRAILNYERARVLEPADPDIKHNLLLARSATVDKIEELPRLFVWEWLDAVRDLFRANTWGFILLASFWLAMTCFSIVTLLSSGGLRKTVMTCAILFILVAGTSGFFCYERYQAESGRNAAIIMSPSVYVKSAPQDSGKDVFILHEGTRVELLEELDGWSRIKIANGQVGWSPSQDLEVI